MAVSVTSVRDAVGSFEPTHPPAQKWGRSPEDGRCIKVGSRPEVRMGFKSPWKGGGAEKPLRILGQFTRYPP